MSKKFHGPGEKYWLLEYDPFSNAVPIVIAQGVSLKELRRIVAKLGHNDYIVIRGNIVEI